jgi:hypothetical protein
VADRAAVVRVTCFRNSRRFMTSLLMQDVLLSFEKWHHPVANQAAKTPKRRDGDIAAPNESPSRRRFRSEFSNLLEVSFRMDWKINRLGFVMGGS